VVNPSLFEIYTKNVPVSLVPGRMGDMDLASKIEVSLKSPLRYDPEGKGMRKGVIGLHGARIRWFYQTGALQL
jgi:hypothetical protein